MSKQILSEPKCIHICFKWLYRLLFYTGCLSFRLNKDKLCLTRFTKIYTNIMRLILVAGFVGGFAVKLNNEQSASAMLDHLSPILKFIMTFESVTSTLTYIQVTLIMDWQKSAHIKMAEQFRYLDENMRMEFPQISWNYHKSLRKYTPLTLVIITFYIVVSMIYFFKVTHCLCDMLTTFVMSVSYAILTAAPGAAIFLQIGAMDMLRIRFRLIRRLLSQMKITKEKQNFKTMQRLLFYVRRFTELILDINKVFGFVIAAGLFYDFGILTNLVYLICQKAFEGKALMQEYIFVFLFMAPRMYKVIIMSLYGKLLENEKRRCLHDLALFANDTKQSLKVQELFRSFLYWKLQNEHDVTIGRTMRCSLNVMFMFLNGITNYVLILIQLSIQQNSITNRVRNHLIGVEKPNHLIYLEY